MLVASVAQLVEQLTLNQLVLGSSPSRGTTFSSSCKNLVEACKTTSLHVPDQVEIIGVDSDELVCELSSPTISSVAIYFERAGYESARLLDGWMRRGRSSRPARIDASATHV